MPPEISASAITRLPEDFSGTRGSLLSRVATGLAIGVIGTGMFAEHTDRAVAVSDTPAAPLTMYTPLSVQPEQANISGSTSANKTGELTHEELNAKDCTSLRRQAKGIYMGLACAQDGAESEVVYSETLEKGWVYSAIRIGNIYKCAYVMAGVLPQMSHKPKIFEACQGFFNDLVKKRFTFFVEYNCGELRPGLEGCRGPTSPAEISDSCKEKKENNEDLLFGNFATDKPSPFNVLGTGEGGFSMPLPNEINSALSYRVKVRMGSADGKAIVVRDTNNTPTLDWGLSLDECVGEEDRDGGPPT